MSVARSGSGRSASGETSLNGKRFAACLIHLEAKSFKVEMNGQKSRPISFEKAATWRL